MFQAVYINTDSSITKQAKKYVTILHVTSLSVLDRH